LKGTVHERILASQPIDMNAARVTGRGIHWDSSEKPNPHARRWEAFPSHLIRPMPTTAATFEDLTGRRVGRFTVVGYLGKLNRKKKAVWLCRCTCGAFESRGAAAITNVDRNPNDSCMSCRYLERVKAGQGNSPFAERQAPPR
jgi:hypothetical protein